MPLPVNCERYKEGLGALHPQREGAAGPLFEPPPLVPRPEATAQAWQTRVLERSSRQRQRCQAGERPPSLPLALLPAASARPGLVPAAFRAVMCPGCWRPAGQGACPPCPLGTPLIRRNVCVCVLLIPSRGKGSPSAEFLTGPCCWLLGGIWVGASAGTPRPRAALQGVPSLGEEFWAEVTGQAGESAPPGFRSHPESLNPRSHPVLQRSGCSPTKWGHPTGLCRGAHAGARVLHPLPRTAFKFSLGRGDTRHLGLWGSLGCLSGSNQVRLRASP